MGFTKTSSWLLAVGSVTLLPLSSFVWAASEREWLGKRSGVLSERQICRTFGWIPACPGRFACVPPGALCCSDGVSYAMPPNTCPDGTSPIATAISSTFNFRTSTTTSATLPPPATPATVSPGSTTLDSGITGAPAPGSPPAGLPPGAKAGIAIGATLVAAILLAVVVWVLWKVRRARPKNQGTERYEKAELSGTPKNHGVGGAEIIEMDGNSHYWAGAESQREPAELCGDTGLKSKNAEGESRH